MYAIEMFIYLFIFYKKLLTDLANYSRKAYKMVN